MLARRTQNVNGQQEISAAPIGTMATTVAGSASGSSGRVLAFAQGFTALTELIGVDLPTCEPLRKQLLSAGPR
jgi:hypothetical protein